MVCVMTSLFSAGGYYRELGPGKTVGRFLLPPASMSSAPAPRPLTEQPCAFSKQRMRPGSALTRTVQFRGGAIFLLGIILCVYRCFVIFTYFSGLS